jgi:hypothetical protein
MANRRKQLKDLKTEERIHEHLSNESDVISEADIKNAKTKDFDAVQPDINEEEGKEERNDQGIDEKKKQGEKEGDADSGMVTPWNILGV